MSFQFPDIGTFAYIEGAWWKVASSPFSDDRQPVKVIFDDRLSFDEFQPNGEIDRRWESTYGVVRILLSRVDEVVDVGRLGRYRGQQVRRLGDVVEGRMTVGLESNDRETATCLRFDGDGRIDPFNKSIHPEEFTDVVEEVTVRFRRGSGDVGG